MAAINHHSRRNQPRRREQLERLDRLERLGHLGHLGHLEHLRQPQLTNRRGISGGISSPRGYTLQFRGDWPQERCIDMKKYILFWLLGIPIPILILVYVLRGCS